jgi:hypothetical protein
MRMTAEDAVEVLKNLKRDAMVDLKISTIDKNVVDSEAASGKKPAEASSEEPQANASQPQRS